MIEAYPLHWPIGYKRTKSPKSSAFRQTPDKAQQFLRNELSRLGATNIIVSSNVPVKKDGYLYADVAGARISEAGVAIYFKYKGNDISMCCDTYERPWENIYALGMSIEAIRSMARWGVSEFLERTFTGFKAIPETTTAKAWHDVLGVPKNADRETIVTAYRSLAKAHHPDSGGDSKMFAVVNEAYQQGLKQLNHQSV